MEYASLAGIFFKDNKVSGEGAEVTLINSGRGTMPH